MERIIISIIAITIILIVLLAAYCWHRKYFPLNDENIIYVMRPSREYFVIGIIGTIVFSIASVLSVIFLDERMIVAFLIFYGFVLMDIYVCIAALLEKYVIKTDSLILYRFLFPPKEIKIHEITVVKYTENRTYGYGSGRKILTGYHNQKKLFSFDEAVKGFDLLHSLFIQSGKIEQTPIIENFSVTETTGNIIRNVIYFCFHLVVSVLIIWYKDNWGSLTPYETIALVIWLLLIPFFLSEVLYSLLWKVTIDFHTISVRNSLGIVKTYEISQITRIQEQSAQIVLFAGQDKIVKIPKTSKNFDFFLERLLQKGIKMYKS